MKSKKIFQKTLVIALIGLYCITPMTASAHAGPLYPYNLLWDITDIHYYLAGNSINYSGEISSASSNWWRPFGAGSNSLYPNTRTYNQDISAIDYYTYSNSADGTLARTDFIRNTSTGKVEVSPLEKNWSYGKIIINTANVRDSAQAAMAGMSVYHFTQSVMAHEQGHVFGLAHHNLDPHSIMCQTAFGREVYTVQVVDNNAFNSKH